MAAPTKPTRVSIIDPPDYGFVPVGKDVTVQAAGETSDGTAQTSMLIRIFYRLNGIPIAQVIYNGRAKDSPGGSFANDTVATGKTKPFRPDTKVFHSIRVLAWDHKENIDSPDKVRSKLTRFQVI